MPRKYTILPLLIAVLCACSRETDNVVSRIDRLDWAIENGDSLTAVLAGEFSAWCEITGFSGSAADYAESDAMRMFGPIVNAEITSLDSVERVLGPALNGFDTRLVAVISPYRQSVVTHPDGYTFIALNHYLGPDNDAYAGFPAHERKRKKLAMLPVDVMQALMAEKYSVRPSGDDTVLSHLLYNGALLNAVAKTLPAETPDSTLLGMTADELRWCEANEQRVWQTLIERNLLFDRFDNEGRRLFANAPYSTAINAAAPGRAALFTALQIARSYEKATGTTPLPIPDFYADKQTLIKSKYTPENAAN